MAMEYLEGLSLHQILQALGAIPVAHAIQIVQEILEALEHAHKRRTPNGEDAPVVHRDISPHNIMISTSGVVKLLDFGISRAETEILGGRLEGKIAYAAPEQLEGQSVDRRSDLWAVGILFYEALCGIRPYEHKEAQAMVDAAKAGSYTPVSGLRPEAGPVEFIIARSLQSNPNERWPDAEAVHKALEAVAPQFGKVEDKDLAKLVLSAGGPQKSILGVEHITSFHGAGNDDAGNRTATIPLAGEKAANLLAGEAFYDTRAEGSVPVQVSQSDLRQRRLAGLIGASLILAIVVLMGLIWSKEQKATATSTPLVSEPVKPKKVVPPVAPPTVKKAAVKASAKPANKETTKKEKEATPTKIVVKPKIPKRKTSKRKTSKRKPKTAKPKPPKKQKAPPPPEPKKQAAPPPVVVPAQTPAKAVLNNSTGRLSITSTPWARIQVDGNALGVTPKLNIQLKPGTHRVVLTPGEGNFPKTKELKIKVKPDGHTRVIINFEKQTFRTLGD